MRALVTGGSGYFGRYLLSELLERGIECINVDLLPADSAASPAHRNLRYVRGDARDPSILDAAAAGQKIDVVFHLATQIGFAVRSERGMYENNVESTRSVVRFSIERRVPKVVFTSSSSVFLGNHKKGPIVETDAPAAVEEYGRSKIESERLLLQQQDHFHSIVIRCPAIVDASRLGMFSILFEFIRDGKKCWIPGDGDVPYQCIYAPDLVDACVKSLFCDRTLVVNVGCDRVPTIRQMIQYVIEHVDSRARVARFPKNAAAAGMKLAFALGVSPLGPTQLRMLTEGFEFDTSLIKRELDWRPTLNSSEMLLRGYDYYVENAARLSDERDTSANRQSIRKLGVVRILKWLS